MAAVARMSLHCKSSTGSNSRSRSRSATCSRCAYSIPASSSRAVFNVTDSRCERSRACYDLALASDVLLTFDHMSLGQLRMPPDHCRVHGAAYQPCAILAVAHCPSGAPYPLPTSAIQTVRVLVNVAFSPDVRLLPAMPAPAGLGRQTIFGDFATLPAALVRRADHGRM